PSQSKDAGFDCRRAPLFPKSSDKRFEGIMLVGFVFRL
ncbi:unnamed protein product, partial [Urochloa humidicola]